MDYKNAWESLGKNFYSIHFSIVISAILVWNNTLLDVFSNISQLLPPDETNLFESWTFWKIIFFGLLFLSSTISLVAYYIIDWLDASIVGLIDKNIKLGDIISWLIAPITLSITIEVIVKHSHTSGIWLYFGLAFYFLQSALVLIFRNQKIENESLEKYFKKSRESYDSLKFMRYNHGILSVIYIVALIAMILVFFFKVIEDIPLLSSSYFILWIIFVITSLINLYIKYSRHKNILVPAMNDVKYC